MINIAKKRLPSPVIELLVYIGFCGAYWYVMRGSLAYYGQQLGLKAWFANDAWAFFLGGLIPTAVYFFVGWFVFRIISVKVGGDMASFRYGLNLTVLTANVLLFLIKFIYIALPLYAAVINVILDPVVTIGLVALYLWYAFKMNYIDKSRYRHAVSYVMGAFLAVYGLLALINLIISVTGR